jgi:hypothetical protein
VQLATDNMAAVSFSCSYEVIEIIDLEMNVWTPNFSQPVYKETKFFKYWLMFLECVDQKRIDSNAALI